MAQKKDKVIAEALEVLRSKIRSVDDYGPRQVVEFHQSANAGEREIQAQRAFQLVRRFLGHIGI